MPGEGASEVAIVAALRAADALTVSLVAEEAGAILGHVAFSPVSIVGAERWYGLAPLSVRPDRQSEGIGSALVEAGLARLRELNAIGCVVLGDPAYYARFGFVPVDGLTYADAPRDAFRAIVFNGPLPSGAVRYHPAFETALG